MKLKVRNVEKRHQRNLETTEDQAIFLGLTPEAEVFLSVYGKNDPLKATQWLRCILPESRYADFEKEKEEFCGTQVL